MDEFQPAAVVEATELPTEAKRRARQVLSNTPVVALLHGGMGKRVDTVEDLLDNVEVIVSTMVNFMHRYDDANDELLALKRDLKAAGRIFKLATQDDA